MYQLDNNKGQEPHESHSYPGAGDYLTCISMIGMLRTMKIRNITSACYHLPLLSNKSDQCHKTHRMQFHLMAQHKTTGADCDECL